MIQTEYIAAGANRHPSAADWYGGPDGGGGHGGLLAFGSGRNVAVWCEPEVRERYLFSFLFLLFIWKEIILGVWGCLGLKFGGQGLGGGCGCACGRKMGEQNFVQVIRLWLAGNGWEWLLDSLLGCSIF
jgi:hypothetical protein